MAISAGPPEGTIQRGRGGFLRNTQDVPFVTDPTGAVVKSGDRKGQPKRLAYGSPSGRGKQIENAHNLLKWGERRIVLGLGLDLALIADCARVAQLDPESDEYREAADRVVVRAKEAAQANLAADRGTHVHSLLEAVEEGRDWVHLAERGEIVGIPVDVQHRLAAAWRAMLDRNGLTVLVTEASCVDDAWRLAGTLDNIVRCTKPLRFALVTGEVVVIPADTVLILDKKTSKKRLGRDGSVQWWSSYAIQIASYAQSVPYDTETETRGEWPWPIDQTHALIGHIDVDAAVAGAPPEQICTLVYVDLTAGREHGGATVVQAKTWEDRRDVFSVAQLDHEIAVPDGVVEGPEVEQPAAGGVGTPAATIASQAADAPGDAHASTGTTPDHAAPVLASPDEGEPADADAVGALRIRYAALPKTVRSGWLKQLAEQAVRGRNGRNRVPYLLTGDDGRHTIRRFEITRGLVMLAEADIVDDDFLRAIVGNVLGVTAWDSYLGPGQVVGLLDARTAARFAQLCELAAAGGAVAHVDSATGRVHLTFPDLAARAA